MKNLIIFLVFIAFPIVSFGQNDTADTTTKIEVIAIDSLEKAPEDQIAVGTFSKNDVTNLSYKKSLELISIKAYRKSLQIKTKEVKTC